MILIGYLALLGALAWALGRRDRQWLPNATVRMQLAFRIYALALGALLATLGVLLARDAAREQPDSFAQDWPSYVLLLTLVGGALVYSCGTALWYGRRALELRVVGWVLLVAALAVPSTLTLVLPLAAALIVTLAELKAERGSEVIPA